MGRIALSCRFALDVLCDKESASLRKEDTLPNDVSDKPSRTGHDDYDPPSLEFAQQLETGPLLIGIDHSVHDGYARNCPLSDPVILYANESVVVNVIQGSGKPCPSDCFTHAMIGDVRLPRRVLEADTFIVSCGLENFERTSWSKQHTHKVGISHDGLGQTTTSSSKASRTTTLKSATLVQCV